MPFEEQLKDFHERTQRATGMFFLACHLFLQPGALRRFIVLLMWLAATDGPRPLRSGAEASSRSR